MAGRGFTLFEVLVVLVILALTAGVAAPLISRGLGRVEAKAAAHEVAAALRRSRSEAITGNTDVALTVDVDARRFQVGNRPAESLPADLTVGLYTARNEQIAAAAGAIRFFPDGSSTGGEITLADGRSEFHVQVQWLTGRVAIVETKAP